MKEQKAKPLADEEVWLLKEDDIKVDRLFDLLVEKFNQNSEVLC